MEIVNVDSLNRFDAGARIAPEQLKDAGLIDDLSRGVKLLGDGALTKRITIAVHRVTESAKSKVTQGGGTIELLPMKTVATQGSKLPGALIKTAGTGKTQDKTSRPPTQGRQPKA